MVFATDFSVSVIASRSASPPRANTLTVSVTPEGAYRSRARAIGVNPDPLIAVADGGALIWQCSDPDAPQRPGRLVKLGHRPADRRVLLFPFPYWLAFCFACCRNPAEATVVAAEISAS